MSARDANVGRALRLRHAPLFELSRYDDEQVAALEQRLCAVRGNPSAELTLRSESLAHRVVSFISHDHFNEDHEKRLAPAFGSIAELVEQTWLPGASARGLGDLLTLADAGPRRARRAPPLDPRRGFTPLPWPDLAAAVSGALFERPRAERADAAAAAESFGALRAWREARKVELTPDGNLPLLAAVFDAHGRLWRALEAFPPARLYLLASTLQKWCGMSVLLTEHHWTPEQGFFVRRSSFVRAVLAYGTAMLVRLVVGAPEARRAIGRARPRAAYRAPGLEAFGASYAVDARLDRLRSAGIERDFDAVLAHTAVLCALTACKAPRSSDKWSWHTTSIHRMAENTAARCSGLLVMDAATVARSYGASMWGAARGVGLSAFGTIVGLNEARAAVLMTRSALGSLLGLHGDLWDLAHAVATALTTGVLPREKGMAALVRTLAERLARTPFASTYARTRATHERVLGAARVRDQADREISLLDRLNVFTDTPAEARKKTATQVLTTLPAAVLKDRETLDLTLMAELAPHLGPSVYYALAVPLAQVEAVHIQFGRTARGNTYPYLVGKEALVASIARWTAHAAANLGVGPTVGTLQQDYALALLASSAPATSP